MAKTKYIIELTEAERKQLTKIVAEGNESERTILRARILLLSDVSANEKMSIMKMADLLGTTHTTVQTVRTEYAETGLDATVYRKERVLIKMKRKINDNVIKEILEIASSEPPKGKNKWSLRLLCKVCMEQGIVDTISLATMQRVMQQENFKLNSNIQEDAR